MRAVLLFAPIVLAGCGSEPAPPAPGTASVDEKRAVAEAAAMIDARPDPTGTVSPSP